MESLNADEILIELNPFGRLQVVFLITSAYIQFFLPMHGQSINFLAAKPDFHCSPREGYSLNESVPLEEDDNGELVFSQCQEYIDPGNSNATQDCQNGWTYSQEYYGDTIITEWDLVCNQYPAGAETSQSIQQVGGMLGAIAFGFLADQYGRRPSFLLSVVIFDIAGVGICFSPNYVVFVIFKFFCGFGQMAIWTTFSSNLSEYMIPKYRNRAMTVPAITFSFGLMFMALLAFLIRDWRYLQLAIVSPYVIGMLGFWFLPESLRWRLSKDNTKEAEILVNKIAKINSKEVTQEMFYQWKSRENIEANLSTISENIVTSPPSKVSTDFNNGTVPMDTKSVSENLNVNGSAGNKRSDAGVAQSSTQSKFLGLFKPPVLHVTIIISILRLTYTLVYFGFALSTGRLAGNPYVNFLLSALVEVPARVLAPFIYKWVRRTYVIFFCYICCGAGLTAIIFIPQQTKSGTDLSILTTVLSLLGKFFVTLTLAGVTLLAVELFPTTLRNSGNGFSLSIARIGAIVAPFMLYADNVLPNFSSYLMAIISFLTAFCALTLPDTRKTFQPQNSADLKVLMKSRKKSSTGVENKAFEEDIDL